MAVKKYLIVVLTLLLIVTDTVSAQRDTKNDIDLDIAAWEPVINTYQAGYAAGRGGRYYQMLWTHSLPPADGSTESPDRLTSKPTDQTETTNDLWQARSGDSLYRMSIDVYNGPLGGGYVTKFQVVLNGQLWEKSVNVGPETHRQRDWQIIEEQ